MTMNLIEWIELPNLGDHRGSLVVAEANRNIPFSIQRLYYIAGAQPDVPRGFHAHKQLQQIAFGIQGSCKMLMDEHNFFHYPIISLSVNASALLAYLLIYGTGIAYLLV